MSTDKLAVEVLATSLAGVTPPVVSLPVTDQIILLGRGASKSSLATADTFLSFVTENKYLPRETCRPCLRFVAVQAVTGVLREDEGYAVQLLVTEGTPEAGRVELCVQRLQDLVLDRKVAVATLGESLLQTSLLSSSPSHDGLNEPSSQQDRQTSLPDQRSSYRPAPPSTGNIWSSGGGIVCPPPGGRPPS